MDGFLFINKQSGWTSRDVCNKTQSIFHQKKVGHIGTLDPFATGLLIVTLGKATKAGRFIEALDKEYEATLLLGTKTTTADLTGEVILNKEVPVLTKDQVINVLESFVGKLEQYPPKLSAVHYKGRKLYEYAHEGIDITDIPSREVEILDISLVDFETNKIKFKCKVSKGTYIRTLGEQIAEKLDTVGHLIELNRTSIGAYTLEGSKYINDINEKDVRPLEDLLVSFYSIKCDDILTKKTLSGMSLKFKLSENIKEILLLDPNGKALAIYERSEGDIFKCVRGLW